MSLQTQVPADFLLFDGLETIYYRSRYGEDGDFAYIGTISAPPSPAFTLREISAMPTRGEIESETDIGNVAAGRRAQVWWCRASDIDGQDAAVGGRTSDPATVSHAKPRDRIVRASDDTVWEVWRVENRCLNSMYRFTCLEVVHP